MNAKHIVKTAQGTIIENPPLARLLFDDTRISFIWVIVRVLVGWEWLTAGWAKLGEAGWMQTGASLKGFWTAAAAVPAVPGKPPIPMDWYRAFIQGLLDSGSYVWFAKLIAVGEFLIGVALILGLFVGIAAFFGAFMSWNFVMAGSVSVNPMMFVGAMVLLLAWKTAGWYGLDRFVLPRLGTPWSRTPKPDTQVPQAAAATA